MQFPFSLSPQHLSLLCTGLLQPKAFEVWAVIPNVAELKMPTGFLDEIQVYQVSLRWWKERMNTCTTAGLLKVKRSRTLWHQQAIGTSNWDWRLLESDCKGLFWNSFLSCPQAALASRPRVWRTLTVTLRDSRAAANACTCQNKISQNKIHSTNKKNFLLENNNQKNKKNP